MRSILLTLLLIASIVACPLLCSSGLAACCARPASLVASSPPKCKCCHPPAQPSESTPPSEDQAPCQGICGGAVLSAQVEWTPGHAAVYLPACDCNQLPVSPQRDHSRPADETHSLSGRALRTLMMSLLC